MLHYQHFYSYPNFLFPVFDLIATKATFYSNREQVHNKVRNLLNSFVTGKSSATTIMMLNNILLAYKFVIIR